MTSMNDALVRGLVERGILSDPRVEQALRSVPRDAFLPEGARRDAALDAPIPIGSGQTISAPHMVAMMAEALDVRPGHRVLEVGGGSGYHAAVLARLAAPGGTVVSVERHAGLVDLARRNLARVPDPPVVEFALRDGSLGVPEHAPFHRISVAAAAPRVPPPLVAQLAPGGVMVLPVGGLAEQDLVRVRKGADGRTTTESLAPVRFVPLLGAHGFPE